MLNIPGGLSGLTAVAEIAVIVGLLALQYRYRPIELTRNGVIVIGVLWVAVVTVEFWILGDRSFVNVEDEGEYSVPLFMYLTRWYDGGLFTHGLGGGGDAYATLFLSGMEYVSLERLLFQLLPPWLAIAVHKVLVGGIAYGGAYLLARRGGGADRWTAVALALWYSLAHRYMLTITLSHGLGYASVALGVYLLVCRLDRKSYFLPAALFAVLHAISFTPTHSALAMGPAVLLVWLFTGMRRPGRFAAAAAMALLLGILNWMEPLYAAALNAPLSYRGTEGLLSSNIIALRFFLGNWEATALVGVAIVLLWRSDKRRLTAGLGMLGAGMALPLVLLSIIPWEDTPLAPLKAFDFSYIAYSAVAPVVLIAAWASRNAVGPRLDGRVMALPAALALAFAGGMAAEAKVFNLAQWLGRGGQAPHVMYRNLSSPAWRPQEPFRVVTVPYWMKPNITAAYGLESFDSVLNIYPSQRGVFWRDGIFKSGFRGGTEYNYIAQQQTTDFLCCKSYRLDDMLDPGRLRLANVGFVISALPLEGAELTLVSGPADGRVPPRRNDTMAVKIKGFLGMLLDDTDAYVYRLSGALPRAYAARAVAAAPEGLRGAAYIDFIQERALAGEAVMSPEDIERLAGAVAAVGGAGKGAVPNVAVARDGYDLELDMPDGGILVVNTVFSPFWRARAGGLELALAEANAIHIAIAVPPGTNRVELRYVRPMLVDRIGAFFKKQ